MEKNECIYCKNIIKNKNEKHFVSDCCGRGMCEDCYQNLQGTDEQIQLDYADDETYDQIKQKYKDATYLCFECFDKWMKKENKGNTKLITKKIQKRFEIIGNDEGDKNPIIITKFFDPTGSNIWYATEIEEYWLAKENKDGTKDLITTSSFEDKERILKNGYKLTDIIFFGFLIISIDYPNKWDSFSLSELLQLKAERDLYHKEKRLNDFFV